MIPDDVKGIDWEVKEAPEDTEYVTECKPPSPVVICSKTRLESHGSSEQPEKAAQTTDFWNHDC